MTTLKHLIFTDLDGTLLDHETYSFTPAKDLIQTLQKNRTPIIPNTSKTRAELLKLREEIGLHSPFITENGAAIYLPKNDFPSMPAGSSEHGDYWRKSFSQSRAHWVTLLERLAPELQALFQSFSQMTLEQLCKATGLTQEQAQLAREREFGEPVLWNGSEDEKALFVTLVEAVGGHVLQGGRFLHVGGNANKGTAMNWLKELYQQEYNKKIITIACGDSQNDIDMLEEADIAILVKSPAHPYPLVRRVKPTIITKKEGPDGWVEGLNKFYTQPNNKA